MQRTAPKTGAVFLHLITAATLALDPRQSTSVAFQTSDSKPQSALKTALQRAPSAAPMTAERTRFFTLSVGFPSPQKIKFSGKPAPLISSVQKCEHQEIILETMH
ncbi:hypothetical protein [uncultured Tateyamaria sp.]|uniref:hypothetical protein n=1 Tax=uncultured Tateyamaria sp. TaxID=455651 RepID=UPI00260F217B|nr:hypothetical protein [uncultured Tateyamaria sp.]